jgi:pimeloyl-ACP methyl ester carboxylesterase
VSLLPDYTVTGDSDATVFLLHGLFGAKEYWRYHTARLVERGYRVVAWDAPGYGLSPSPKSVSIGALAAAAAKLIDTLGTRINIVHGHSMGGQLTPRIHSLIPDRIAALVIVATIGYFGNRTAEEQEAFIRDRAAAVSKPGAEGMRELVQSMFSTGASGPEVELVRSVALQTRPETVRASLAAVRGYSDNEALSAIHGIDVPTLFIAGAADQTGTPEGMRRVSARVPGSEFAVIEGSGHYPWAEKPDDFSAALFAFLRRYVPVGQSVR